MRDKKSREEDVLRLIEGLDISPTMYKNATDKYKAVGTYLQEQGLECDIFPQGSFSLGTVVRPYRESKEVAYDLDFICCINKSKEETSAKYVKNIVKEVLCTNEVYKEKLQSKEWDKCWTLEYAKANGVGFNMDIVPGVPEADEVIQSLIEEQLNSEDARLSVSITNKTGENYFWLISNPKAYRKWFEKINRPFLEYDRDERRKILLEHNRMVYNSIEEIPQGLERSALQRVIQILKHHRDRYYCRINKENQKPTSAIITTICAQIAQDLSPSLNVFQLLRGIVKEFEIYSDNEKLTEAQFDMQYHNKKLIRKISNKWYIMNPVNPKDNLADSWNEDLSKAEVFFKWVKAMKLEYLDSFESDDNSFIAILENNFGSDYVKHKIDMKNYESIMPQPIVNTPQPWRNTNGN